MGRYRAERGKRVKNEPNRQKQQKPPPLNGLLAVAHHQTLWVLTSFQIVTTTTSSLSRLTAADDCVSSKDSRE